VVSRGGSVAELGNVRRGMELIGEACTSAREGIEGAEDGRRKQKRKMQYLEDAKGAQAKWVGEGDGGLWRERGSAGLDPSEDIKENRFLNFKDFWKLVRL
jgi:hypothetical protein